MVYFVSNSRQTRTRFETLAKDFECAFFMTFTGLERELRSQDGCYSVVIDENLEMAACLSFISRHYSDRNLKKILMISSQTEGVPSLPDDRISICSYSEFEDRLSQLRGKDEDDDGLASLLLGDSPAMVHLRSEVKRIGAAGHNVLVYGPTGSGKELVARALHRHSPRHYRISEETEEGRIYRQHIGIVSAVLIQNMCTLIGNNQAAFRYLPIGKINRVHIHSGTGTPIAVHVCQRQHHRFRMNAISVHRKFAVDVAQQDDAASQAERQPRQADEGIGPGARQMTQCVS